MPNASFLFSVLFGFYFMLSTLNEWSFTVLFFSEKSYYILSLVLTFLGFADHKINYFNLFLEVHQANSLIIFIAHLISDVFNSVFLYLGVLINTRLISIFKYWSRQKYREKQGFPPIVKRTFNIASPQILY